MIPSLHHYLNTATAATGTVMCSRAVPRTVSDQRYDTVFWDVGGVLLDTTAVREGHAEFVARLLEEYGLETSTDEALERWRTAVGDHFRERDGTEFRSAEAAYGRGVDAVVGESVTKSEWKPIFRERLGEHVHPNPHAPEVVAALDDAGVYQAVLSDVDREEGEFILDRLGVREHFEHVTTSEEVGRTKPDDAMFEAALSKSPHPPERTVMVGDRYDHDVVGAAAHGIDAAGYGADDGPAVTHRLDDLRDLLEVVGVEFEGSDGR